MPKHPAIGLAAPLTSAGAFLGVTAAWLYDVHFSSPGMNHPNSEYLFVAGPHVVMGVFGGVNYFARASLIISWFALVSAVFIAGCGLLMWFSYLSGSDRDGWGLGFGTIFLWIVAVPTSATGLIAILLHKAWSWWIPCSPDAKDETLPG